MLILFGKKMLTFHDPSQSLAEAITQAASKQTYYTIRLLVDRTLVQDAFRAYAYFRWVDDILDDERDTKLEKLAFIHRQQSLLEACYRGEVRDGLCAEEHMLVELIRHDQEENSGLQAYLRNMMGVMDFDARRCGRVISQAELSEYSRMLSTAVTEALYHFIGHGDSTPRGEDRYLAVTAAHITHMLRDTFEDTATGYYNIPLEYLHQRGIAPRQVESQAYREWVCSRVELAQCYFREGKRCMMRVKSLRCRLAGYAYIARFEWMLHLFECDNFHLRCDYPERKSPRAGLWMGWTTLASILAPHG